MSSLLGHLRARLTGALLDAPGYSLALWTPGIGRAVGRSWETLHNRGERISQDPQQRGIRCHWDWTSSLRYCELRPRVGLRLLRTALEAWPIGFAEAPRPMAAPQVSFIVGHRGVERLRLLLATVASIAAQEGVGVECIVVEQASEPVLPGLLPAWVRHVHTPPPDPDMPYSRSWAFNVGARAAAGEWLVFHDNDILVPRAYATQIVQASRSGFEAARLQRFVFYLDSDDSENVMATRSTLAVGGRLQAVQNCEGHTLAARSDVYWRTGGHDEAFTGWGGEDNEFFDRLRDYRLHDCAYLPFVHLYHAPQPGKGARHVNSDYFESRMSLPRANRVAELSARRPGLLSGPISR